MLDEIRASIARARSWQLQLPWLLFAAVLIALAFYITWQFVEPAPPRTLRLSAGAPDGAYARAAEAYRIALERDGVTIEVLPSNGSVENLARLREGSADIAFVQGGIAEDTGDGALTGLASLYSSRCGVFCARTVGSASCTSCEIARWRSVRPAAARWRWRSSCCG